MILEQFRDLVKSSIFDELEPVNIAGPEEEIKENEIL